MQRIIKVHIKRRERKQSVRLSLFAPFLMEQTYFFEIKQNCKQLNYLQKDLPLQKQQINIKRISKVQRSIPQLNIPQLNRTYKTTK